ncbi:MAG TPA: hypothetical protein VJ970_01175, partial [Flavobacteriaceae bacterium]|nr:hypothetical protein [Flavobacteriaceae bacterium]
YTIAVILLTIILMLYSFVASGYKAFSIILLSVFGITSYVLSFKLLKDINQHSLASKLVKWGIYYYLLSSLATWFLAGVIVTEGKTDLYFNTVYFYLHFLYNGFFVFALFGLLFKSIENRNIVLSKSLTNKFFVYLNIACIPTYALSILWSDVAIYYNVIGGLGALAQLLSFFYLLLIIKNTVCKISFSTIEKWLLYFAIASYALKISMQVASAFPYFVEKAVALKPFFIIGYLHLFTLGFMSALLILLLVLLKKFKEQLLTFKSGVLLFLIGVLVSELLLFGNGFSIMFAIGILPNYQFFLVVFSALIFIGIFLLTLNSFSKIKK